MTDSDTDNPYAAPRVSDDSEIASAGKPATDFSRLSIDFSQVILTAGQITGDDRLRVQTAQQLPRRARFWLLGPLLLIILIVTAAAMPIALGIIPSLDAIVGVLIVESIAILAVPAILRRRKPRPFTSAAIGEHFLRVSQESSTKLSVWDTITGYKRDGDLVLLYSGDFYFVPFPKRHFASQTDWENFLRLLGRKCVCLGEHLPERPESAVFASAADLERGRQLQQAWEAFELSGDRIELGGPYAVEDFYLAMKGARRFTLWTILLAGVALLAYQAALGWPGMFWSRPRGSSDILTIWMGAFMLVFPLLQRYLIPRRLLASWLKVAVPSHWQFADNGVQITAANTRLISRWEFFKGYRLLRGGLLLRQREPFIMVVPRRWASREQWPALASLVAKNLKKL